MKRLFFGSILCLVIAIIGCGGQGAENLVNPWIADQFKGKDGEPTQPAPVTYSVSGNIILPSDTSATLSASIGKPGIQKNPETNISGSLEFLRFKIRLTNASGTSIAGPASPDSTGKFTLSGIPGGTNYRIEVVGSSTKVILKRHIDKLETNLASWDIDSPSTAIAILVQESGFSISADRFESAVKNLTIDLTPLTSVIGNVIRGVSSLDDTGIQGAVVGSLGSGKIQEIIQKTPVKNFPPLVDLLQPLEGASFTFGTSINIIASASDKDGNVAKVEFYIDETKIGESSRPPFQWTVQALGVGPHKLSAKAIDNAGESTLAGPITLYVYTKNNQPPTIALVSPAPGSSFAFGATIPISVTANDPDGSIVQVEFFADGAKIGEENNPPYSFEWRNPSSGSHTLTAKAFDNGGSFKISAPVSCSVVSSATTPTLLPPTIIITSPLNGANQVAGKNLTINVSVSDADGSVVKVEFYQENIKIGESVQIPFAFTWATIPSGTYSITAKATDNSGNSTISSPVRGNALFQNQEPVVAMTSPLNGSVVTPGTNVTISADASDPDGTVVKVAFYQNGTKFFEVLASPFSVQLPFSTEGTFSFTAVATDNNGATKTSAPVSITVKSSAGGTSAKELIITEFGTNYYSNVPSWIEIYNNSDQQIDLSQYTLLAQSRPNVTGSFQWVDQEYALSTILPARSYVLLIAKIGNEILASPRSVLLIQNNNIPWWQDRGYLELLKNGATVDFVHFGNDAHNPKTPSAWSGTPAVSLPSTANDLGKSLARNISLADTNSGTDWVLRQFATPGGPNDANADSDSDGDGIPDACEAAGATFVGLPLYDWGARPNQKDIFIHIDSMNSSDLGILPRKESLDKVFAVFNNRGYTLHFDVGNLFGSGVGNYNLDNNSHKVPFSNGISMGETTGKANLYKYKADYMDISKRNIFHYCIFANSQNADGSKSISTGLGELNGNDFFLTMGNRNFRSDTVENLTFLINIQAATLMHELGHNLGLKHGGNEDTNYKPNYRSLMNYLYSSWGLPIVGNAREGDRYYHLMWEKSNFSQTSPFYQYFGASGSKALHVNPYTNDFIMDYSDGKGATLNEGSLLEANGIGYPGSTGVDWNGDGDKVDTLNLDVNFDGAIGAYSDFNDWANITMVFSRQINGLLQGSGGSAYPLKKHCFVVDDYQPVAVEEP